MNETSTNEIITGTERRRATVVGLRTDVCSHDLAVQRVGELARSGTGGYVCLSIVHMVMESHDDLDFEAMPGNSAVMKSVNISSLISLLIS